MGGKSKTKSHSESNSTADYIDWTKGSGQKGLSDLNDLYNRDKNRPDSEKIYQGDRVIGDYNPDTNAGIDASNANARNSAHTTTDIHDMTGEAVNPYFEQSLQDSLGKMGARLSNSAAYGGYGTSDTGRVIGRELSQSMTGAMNQQWNDTQNRRLQANQLEQQAYRNQSGNINDAINASGKRDVLHQAQLDAQKEKWQDGQDADWNNLSRFIEGTNSIRMGTGQGHNVTDAKATTKQQSNPFEIATGIGQLGTNLFSPTKGAGLFASWIK